jgi:receptor protein-tyrosine kinase
VNTNLVVIQAEGPTGVSAARLANTVAEVTREIVTKEQRDRYTLLIRRVLKERKKLISGGGRRRQAERRALDAQLIPVRTARDLTRPVVILDPAAAPANPFSPRPVRNGVVGGIVGLILALMIAGFRTAMDRRLRGTSGIAEITDAPILATVREEALGRVNTGATPGDAAAELDLEAFRVLRTNLDYLHIDSRVSTVLVTSPLAAEGKSTVASSLAVAQGLAGRRTLVVECDLRRPVLAARCGLDPTPGLTDYLAGHAEPQDVVRVLPLPVLSANGNGNGPEETPGIAVICAGTPAPRPAELLASERFAAFLEQVKQVYDIVILDSPPLLPVGDALELVERVDAVLICVRSHQTTRDDLRAAVRALDKLPDRAKGIVVTGLRKVDDSYAYYYGPYAYASGSED